MYEVFHLLVLSDLTLKGFGFVNKWTVETQHFFACKRINDENNECIKMCRRVTNLRRTSFWAAFDSNVKNSEKINL